MTLPSAMMPLSCLCGDDKLNRLPLPTAPFRSLKEPQDSEEDRAPDGEREYRKITQSVFLQVATIDIRRYIPIITTNNLGRVNRVNFYILMHTIKSYEL